MREALIRIVSLYSEIAGTSNIVLLFVVSILAVVLIDENSNDLDERRRLNPTVFLLSLWSGISYAVVRLISKKKKPVVTLALLFSAVGIALSGGFVFSKDAGLYSVYVTGQTAFVIISLICTFVYLVIYYFISRQLFTERSDRLFYMIIAVYLHLFDFYSEKAAAFSLVLAPASISSIIIHGALPLVLFIYPKYEDRIRDLMTADSTDEDDNEEIPEEWDMKKHKILNIRNMAIVFAVFAVMFAALVFVLNNKINSLYDATVTLEKAAKSKMTVEEVRDADGMVALTLMISPDGSVTAIDGKDESNGQECYDLITKYTDKVDKWYLYSDNAEDKGAYDFCRGKGMAVKETYIIAGIEKIEK